MASVQNAMSSPSEMWTSAALNETVVENYINDVDCDSGDLDESCFFGNMTLSMPNPYEEFGTRVALVITYSFVFSMCLSGNVLVLFVITRKSRMHTRTDMFMANLAMADLLVGLFCVLPNLCHYLFHHWVLGQALCKIHKYIEAVNLTASMFLLEVIAVERYIVIRHPLRARGLFTRYKMYTAQVLVWIVSAGYNVPFLIAYDLVREMDYSFTNNTYQASSNSTITFCVNKIDMDTEIFYMHTFVIWYVVPLFVMTFMYTQIARTLWTNNLFINIGSEQPQSCPTSPVAMNSVSNDSTSGTDSKKFTSPMTKLQRAGHQSGSGDEVFPDTSSKESIREPSGLVYPDLTVNLPNLDFHGLKSNKPSTSKVDKGTTTRHFAANKLSSNPKAPVDKIQSFKATKKPEGLTVASSNPQKPNKSPSNSYQDVSSSSTSKEAVCLKFVGASVEEICKEDEDREDLQEGNAPIKIDKTQGSGKKFERKPLRTKSQTDLCLYNVTSQRNSRRRVIRLLIVVLVTFVVLVLPYHLRLVFLSAKVRIKPTRDSALFPLVCDLLMYLNSAVNPFLYSMMSRSFRRNLREALYANKLCRPRPRTAGSVRFTAHRRVESQSSATKKTSM